MADATSQAHSHAHDPAVGHVHAPNRVKAQKRAARLSLLESSATERLLGVAIALAALWAGVFWALR
ncbi:hypothetical protein F7D14_12620 [Methylocystis parvus]|uniref:Uncharacterized protein n=1 Tax=Methylocystis parvus TaxID=134 RepID=A0A6B8MAC0_9HYPH|nr:hypothetical protein F7D14_12620 [Methylocystis parvus]